MVQAFETPPHITEPGANVVEVPASVTVADDDFNLNPTGYTDDSSSDEESDEEIPLPRPTKETKEVGTQTRIIALPIDGVSYDVPLSYDDTSASDSGSDEEIPLRPPRRVCKCKWAQPCDMHPCPYVESVSDDEEQEGALAGSSAFHATIAPVASLIAAAHQAEEEMEVEVEAEEVD